MKRTHFGFLAASISVCILLVSCPSDESDDGGVGADFDSTLYYTKTETYSRAEADAKLQSCAQVNYNQGGNIAAITASGSSSGGSPWNVPSNARYGFFLLSVGNFSGSSQEFRVRVGSTGTSGDKGFSFYSPSGWYEERVLLVPFGATVPSSVYAWLEAPGTFPTSGFTVSVQLLFWVTQETFIQ